MPPLIILGSNENCCCCGTGVALELVRVVEVMSFGLAVLKYLGSNHGLQYTGVSLRTYLNVTGRLGKLCVKGLR